MIGYGRELPDDEAIGVAVGWWPCMPAPSGAYVQMNGDGSAHDRDGRAGERQRRGDGDADVRRRRSSASIRTTSRSCIRTPTSRRGTWARAVRRPPSTAGARSSPPPSEVREQLLDAAAEQLEVDAEDLELTEGVARVKGSPERSVADRRPRRRDRHDPREGFGRGARGADRRHRRLRGQARQRDVPGAPADHPGRAREGRPRDRRRARAEGRGGARLGRILNRDGRRRAGATAAS